MWYAYIADRSQAEIADAIQTAPATPGLGLDFGEMCDNDNASGAGFASIFALSDTTGYTVARDATGGSNGATNVDCTAAPGATAVLNHVVRESKTPSNVLGTIGQIGIDANAWPFIQLYDFNPTGNVIVQYNKGGNPQTTVLTFDTLAEFLGYRSLSREVSRVPSRVSKVNVVVCGLPPLLY